MDLGCEEGVLVAEQGQALRTLELPESLPPVPGCLIDDPEDTEDMLRCRCCRYDRCCFFGLPCSDVAPS